MIEFATMQDDLDELAALWVQAKAAERDAVDERRRIEDRMCSMIGFAETTEGTETASPEHHTIKISGRIDRKVDVEKVQALAAEHGLTEHLSSLFRWKPEINLAAWRATDESITRALAPAITAKPGRPSFSITPKE